MSKRVDQQVSKGTEVHLESLTSAKVCENVGAEQLQIELDRYTKILNEFETFGKEQKKKKAEALILKSETWRKPCAKNSGEYDEKKEARKLKHLEALEADIKAREAKGGVTMSDVEPDDPVPVTTDQNANVVKNKASKTVCTVLSAGVPPPVVEPPHVDPIVISSDENNGDNSDNAVEKWLLRKMS